MLDSAGGAGMLDMAGLAAEEDIIRALARLQPPPATFAPTAVLAVRGVTVELDLSGTIDVAAERARLGRDLAAARRKAAAATGKLAEAQFLTKAPEPVVAKVRARLVAAETDIARIGGQLDALPTA